jgi:predicted Fe-Mo cluster-binding NifX family protein
MKILVTCKENNENCEIDPRFGRCLHFAVVDLESGEISFHDNSENASGRQGAGVGAAKLAADLGVEYLLTGNCGPKAFQVLEASGVKVVVGISGKLKEVVENFKNGKYSTIDKPNVEGHW